MAYHALDCRAPAGQRRSCRMDETSVGTRGRGRERRSARAALGRRRAATSRPSWRIGRLSERTPAPRRPPWPRRRPKRHAFDRTRGRRRSRLGTPRSPRSRPRARPASVPGRRTRTIASFVGRVARTTPCDRRLGRSDCGTSRPHRRRSRTRCGSACGAWRRDRTPGRLPRRRPSCMRPCVDSWEGGLLGTFGRARDGSGYEGRGAGPPWPRSSAHGAPRAAVDIGGGRDVGAHRGTLRRRGPGGRTPRGVRASRRGTGLAYLGWGLRAGGAERAGSPGVPRPRGDWIRTGAESARFVEGRASRARDGGCGPRRALHGVHPRSAPCSQGAPRPLRRHAGAATAPAAPTPSVAGSNPDGGR